jgi:membrane protein
MKFSFFVARRFFKSMGTDKTRASRLTVTIATAGVAVGLAVMLLTVCIILGFKSEITKKVEGFGGHIEILDFATFAAPDAHPVSADPALLNTLRRLPNVKNVMPTAQKMGILKTADDYQAITLKGLPKDADTSALASSLVEGRLPAFGAESSNDLLISRKQANDLNLKVGDRVFAYFFEENIRMRRFKVCGIYSSNMAIFDKTYAMTPLSTVRKLNNWEGDEASVVEIRLNRLADTTSVMPLVRNLCQQQNQAHSNRHTNAISITDLYAQIFSWLSLLDFNMVVILIIMLCISGFTMVSGLLILVLERTQTIGLLKALGATNSCVRRIFLNFAVFITLRGLLIGDILALGIAFAQKQWGLLRLDPATYYLETVPLEINWLVILLVNVGTLFATILALVGPSYVVSRIQPAKAIRFE